MLDFFTRLLLYRPTVTVNSLALCHTLGLTVFKSSFCSIFNTLYSHIRKCHNWTVCCYGGNRTLCLPHCLSLFGMFIY